jgi:DNA-binding IclR family transcriptional regulator
VRRRDGSVHAAISISFQRATRPTRDIVLDLKNLRLCAAELGEKLGSSGLV